jgi:hypothetical protein
MRSFKLFGEGCVAAMEGVREGKNGMGWDVEGATGDG